MPCSTASTRDQSTCSWIANRMARERRPEPRAAAGLLSYGCTLLDGDSPRQSPKSGRPKKFHACDNEKASISASALHSIAQLTVCTITAVLACVEAGYIDDGNVSLMPVCRGTRHRGGSTSDSEGLRSPSLPGRGLLVPCLAICCERRWDRRGVAFATAESGARCLVGRNNTTDAR